MKQTKTLRQGIATQQNESVTLEIGSSYPDLAFQISVPQMCRRICRLVSFSRLLSEPSVRAFVVGKKLIRIGGQHFL